MGMHLHLKAHLDLCCLCCTPRLQMCCQPGEFQRLLQLHVCNVWQMHQDRLLSHRCGWGIGKGVHEKLQGMLGASWAGEGCGHEHGRAVSSLGCLADWLSIQRRVWQELKLLQPGSFDALVVPCGLGKCLCRTP